MGCFMSESGAYCNTPCLLNSHSAFPRVWGSGTITIPILQMWEVRLKVIHLESGRGWCPVSLVPKSMPLPTVLSSLPQGKFFMEQIKNSKEAEMSDSFCQCSVTMGL